MTLPPFIPKPWIAEIHQHLKPDPNEVGTDLASAHRRNSRNRPKLAESEAFLTDEEARAYAAKKSQVFDAGAYVGTVREATPKDLAEQRLQEIAEALAGELDAALKSNEDILAYDTHLHGSLDFSTPIQAEIEAVLESCTPEDQDPMSMGWVGGDGLP